MEDDGFIEVTDFEFHGLRRVRLPAEERKSLSTRRLAVSSRYSLGVILRENGVLLSFSTQSVHALKATGENINEEVVDLQTKQALVFDPQTNAVAVAANCDGSLIAVLTDSPHGPLIHIFDAQVFALSYQGDVAPMTTVRVSSDGAAKATVMEWSPASADILAAAASDRSIVTIQLCLTEMGKFTMISEKKLGAVVRTMSWSPKGKQLVAGDECGKVTQLKPELDVVRSTSAPPTCSIANPVVVGLCWLSTTDFFTVYGSADGKSLEATIMVIKKDKPVSWSSFPELAFVSGHSPLPLDVACLPLHDWNLTLFSSSKSAEVSVVGKKAEKWQVWGLDDVCRADLPTDSAKADTFPAGVAIDLSAQHQITLSEDGLKKARPSPILFLLTTDGLILAFHAISFNGSLPSLQVNPQPMNSSSVRAGRRLVTGQLPARTPMAALPPSTPAPASCPPAMIAVPPAALPPPAPPAPPAAASTHSLLESLTKAPICTPNTNRASVTVSATPSAPIEQKTREEVEGEKEAEMRDGREKVNHSLSLLQQKLNCLADEMNRLQSFLLQTKPMVEQIKSEMWCEKQRGILPELAALRGQLEMEEKELEERMQHTSLAVNSKAEMLQDMEGLAAIRDTFDYDREQSMELLTERVHEARARYNEMMKQLQKVTVIETPRLTPSMLSFDRATEKKVDMTLQKIRHSIQGQREKCDDLGRQLRTLQQLRRQKGLPERKLEKSESVEEKRLVAPLVLPHSAFLSTVAATLTQEDILKMRTQLRTALNKVLGGGQKPRRSEFVSSPAPKSPSITTANLSQLQNRLLEITTPRKALKLPDLAKLVEQPARACSSPLVIPCASPAPSSIRISGPSKPISSPLNPLATSTPVSHKLPVAAAPSISFVPKFGAPSSSSSVFTSAKSLSEQQKQPAAVASSSPAIPSSSPSASNFSSPPGCLSTNVSGSGSVSVPSPLSSTAISNTGDVTVSASFTTPVSAAPPVSSPSTLELFTPAISSAAAVSPSASSANAMAAAALQKTPDAAAPSVTSPDTAEMFRNSVSAAASVTPSAMPATSVFAPQTSTPGTLSSSLAPASSSSFFTSPTASTTAATGTPPSIFGGVAAPTAQSSLFSKSNTFTSPSPGSSIFGGGSSTAASFSFKPAAAAAPPPSSSSFNFNKPASSGFAAAAAAAAASAPSEEGMMEDEGGNGGVLGGKGSSFMTGLGSSSTQSSAPKNVFGGSWMTAKPAAAPSFPSSAFGGGGGQTSSFSAATGGSSFAAAAQQAAQGASPSSGFGAKPSFGAGPQFGAKPAFGASTQKPSLFANSSSTSQAANTGAFSAFAGQGSVFGKPAQGSSSIFGGGAGGDAPKPASSIFGGGTSSFSSWR